MKATLALLIALAMFVWPTNAFGHENGKAQPRIAAVLGSDRGLMRTLTVRLRDADSGDPILNATVVVAAEMTSPHAMRTAPVRLPRKGGLYRGRVRFLMPGTWTLKIRVQGPAVVTAEAALRATVSRAKAAAPPHTTAPAPAALPMNLEEELTRRDFVSMAMLWTHSIAALGWIVGVLLLLLVLVPRRPILVGSLHARLVSGYRAWGAWLHWGLIPIVVATGIYNMRFVTPFPLVWRPSELAELRDIPYGVLYEAILVVKLALFVSLLITGTQMLLRTVRPRVAEPEPAHGVLRSVVSALGPAGVVYLATVPLIIAAAVALRYVHVLSHVAEVVEGGR